MAPLDMWYVGKLHWPNKASGGAGPPMTQCKKTPGGHPCKNNGEFWLAEGEPCISPCYVNPVFAPAFDLPIPAACTPSS